MVLDGISGAVQQTYYAPDSLQVVESTWVGDDIVVSAVSEGGMGLYYAYRGYSTLLAPQPVKITKLSSREKEVLFTSDLNSVTELYSLDTRTLSLTRLTFW